jgi:hypothetical protein
MNRDELLTKDHLNKRLWQYTSAVIVASFATLCLFKSFG